MSILITGTSNGVGKAAAKKFLSCGYNVVGLDKLESTIDHPNYTHYMVDVSIADDLPNIDNISVIINNAGIVTPQRQAMQVNLGGYINVLEKYMGSPHLKSVLNIGSTASFKGYDNIRYCASQGARDALTKWCANNLGNDSRHIICNSLNLDGIVPAGEGTEGTALEPELYAHPELLQEISDLSVLKRLTTVEEIAEWIYFLTVVNTCATGQIISVDGELTGAFKFIEYPGWND